LLLTLFLFKFKLANGLTGISAFEVQTCELTNWHFSNDVFHWHFRKFDKIQAFYLPKTKLMLNFLNYHSKLLDSSQLCKMDKSKFLVAVPFEFVDTKIDKIL
jgi:hypothetical protein